MNIFDIAMRFYLRELDKPELLPYVRKEYERSAQQVLDHWKEDVSYSRYQFLLDRYKARSSLGGRS